MWNKHKARANAQTSHCQNKNGHGHKVWQQLSYRSHLHIWENDNMKVLFLTVLFFGCLFLVLFLSFIFWRGSVLLLFCLFVCLFLNFGQRQEMQKHLPWTEKLLLCHCICTYSTKSTWLKLNCIRLPPPQKRQLSVSSFRCRWPLRFNQGHWKSAVVWLWQCKLDGGHHHATLTNLSFCQFHMQSSLTANTVLVGAAVMWNTVKVTNTGMNP